jgi:hypothetical protein
VALRTLAAGGSEVAAVHVSLDVDQGAVANAIAYIERVAAARSAVADVRYGPTGTLHVRLASRPASAEASS